MTFAKNQSEQNQIFQNQLEDLEKRIIKAIGAKRSAAAVFKS